MLRRARILEVYEVRRGLEVEAARLAASRSDPAGLRELDELLAHRQELVGAATETFVDADLKFHREVIALAGNTLLTELYDQFHEPLRGALIALVDCEPDLPDTSGDHAALLAALHAADPDRAAQATADHFNIVIDMLRKK
ncbi:MAG: FadR family transcriptional regulator [Pseudonocardiales bacterium]|nr:FadR family transcriptional regulator [Pseudonocardiales bacterium]